MVIRALSLAAVAAAASLCATHVGAAAQRTFVSTGGVANPACSLAAPCRAFSEAITATLAGGEIIVLDSGGYGGLTITKSVSIVAPPGVYAGVTVSSGDGITISAGTSDVVKLRGLTLTGLGGVNGIKANSVGMLEVEDARVSGFSFRGLFFAADGRLTVTNSVFENNGESGLVAQVTGGLAVVSIDQSRFDRNVANGAVISTNATGSIVRSTASHNPSVGFLVDEGAIATLADCKVTSRYEPIVLGYGILVRGAGTRATIARCDVSGAHLGFAVQNSAHAQVVDSSAQSGGVGFAVQYDGSELFAERSTAANNQTGFETLNGSTAKLRLSNCTVTGNSYRGVDIGLNGLVETRGNNTMRANIGGDVMGGGTFTAFGPL